MKIFKLSMVVIILIILAMVVYFVKFEKLPTHLLSDTEINTLTTRANNNDKEACWDLYLHYDELGDKEISLLWLRKGSLAHDARAQYEIYVMLRNSSKQSEINEGLQELNKAATSGDSNAQLELGNVYNNGVIIHKDVDTAKSWYYKSAMNGEIEAMLKLSQVIFDTDRDLVKSYAFLLLAKDVAKLNKAYDIKINAMQQKITEYANTNKLILKDIVLKAEPYAAHLKNGVSTSKPVQKQ